MPTFAQPGWLALLLLVPLLALGAYLTGRVRARQWREFTAPRLRAALLRRGSPWPRWLALVFLLVATAVLVVALARPQGDAGVKTEKTMGRNVLIALDLSRSMRVSDVKPDRLSQAKVVIYELLEELPNDRIGLIGFAGRPFLYAPLTIDHPAVRETVEQIDENWAPVGGSDLASAVRLATETLRETGQKNNALIILSDGEEHEGDIDAMLAEAARSGVYIFAIGVGTEEGGLVPSRDPRDARPMYDSDGRPVLSRVQPDVLRKLAEETGGRYVMAGSGGDIPAMVRAAVQELDAFEVEGRERRVAIEFYQWLVLPAILFLMISVVAGTRWRGVRAVGVAACALFLAAPGARADAVSEAREALESGRHEEARDAYRDLADRTKFPGRAARYRIGEGTAAYRARDLLAARSAFSEALLTDDAEVLSNAHLGLGNTLFQLGWQGLAGEHYPTEPDQLPDMQRFDALVTERLAQLLESEVPDVGETDGFVRLRAILLNWSDAVRHYESALAADPENPAAGTNRATTLAYLERLDELLEQEEQATEQQLPQPGQGEPQPGPGQGDPQEGDPQEGEGQEGQEGPGGREPRDEGEGGEGDEDEGDGDGGEEENDESDSGDEGDPNETPEERAQRILEENADLERGPPSPGRHLWEDPEKDW